MKHAVIHYDPHSDTLSIVTRKGSEEQFVEVVPGVSVEFNAKGQVLGIEILRASRILRPVVKPLYQHLQHASSSSLR